MVCTVFKTSAPGSVMLMGEHAVLAGKLALCAAVAQRIYVSLQPRRDNIIHLSSAIFPDYHTTVETINVEKPYQFVLGALSAHQINLTDGCDIHIEADFSHEMGLGSSAAVTVATVAALRQWLNLPGDLLTIMQSSRAVVRHVQGRGSGADVAASTFGGVAVYRQDDVAPPMLLTLLPDLMAVYCGYKTATPDVIHFVMTRFQDKPEELADIYDQIDACTKEAVIAWQQADWPLVGQWMNHHFKLQQKLGVSDDTLDYLIETLQQQPHCYGAKISGSGLGDCVIGLGQINTSLFPSKKFVDIQQFAVQLSHIGVEHREGTNNGSHY